MSKAFVSAFILAAAILPACGTTPPQRGPLTLTGAITGVFRPGPPPSCGPGATRVTGPYDSRAGADNADMVVTDTDQVSLDTIKGTYVGRGVTFRPSSGWDIDADLVQGGAHVHLAGHLGC